MNPTRKLHLVSIAQQLVTGFRRNRSSSPKPLAHARGSVNPAVTPKLKTAPPSRKGWLNRSVIGMSITSFLSDAGHEMVTAVLPGFFATLGMTPAILGWIEGAADASSSFVKLGAGWYSDRLGHRKRLAAFDYFLTGTALAPLAAAVSWPLVLIGRLIAWAGRGLRSPLRDAMLAESVAPMYCGKTFGLHRAADTVGAIVGPLIGAGLLATLPAPSRSAPFRAVFLLSLIPGLASVLSFMAMVGERPRPENRSLRFWGAVRDMPKSYAGFLRGTCLFGLGDFSHTLLILAAIQLLSPAYGAVRAAQIAALLYVLHNVVYAASSFPVGNLVGRTDTMKLLVTGYLLGAFTAAQLASLMFVRQAGVVPLAMIFALAGFYLAIQDTLEGVIPVDMTPAHSRGTAYGLLGAVNGVGDLGASALVGSLWSAVSATIAFDCAGALMLAGALLVIWNWKHSSRN
ncbi:MAG TPA: MFS transporter [Bryobacteraceae bacterium]